MDDAFCLQLEAALLDDCTVNDIYAICQGKRTFPDTLRSDLWMCCLVTHKSDALAHFDEIYDLPFQKLLRSDCQNFVDTLGNDELEQVGVLSDLESILTFYCKNRNLKYESNNGWIETLLPILSLKLKRSDTYNLFEAIRDTYIPKDSMKHSNVYHVFRLLILYHDPELCAVLDTYKITPEMYSMSWFQSLFASTCQLSVVLLIWDLYFQQSDPFLVFFLSLIMLVNRRDEIISMRREEKTSIVEFLSNMPCELEADDVIDFCSLAQYYSTRTPSSFKSEMLNQLFGTQTNIEEPVHVSQALCLPVSVYELIENSSGKPEGSVRFFLVDCRPVDQYNYGHLPTAFHLDYNLMLTEPTSFQTAMQGLLRAQKSAIEVKASGEHLCFLGSGRIEEDQFVHMVVASFLQKSTQFVSILSGGYAAIHDYFGDTMLDCLEDHDVHRCLICSNGINNNNNNLPLKNQKPSTSSAQKPQFDLFSKFSTAMKSKTSDVKSKFFDIIANPSQSSNQNHAKSQEETVTEKHVSMSEKNGKRYRNLAPVFGLDEDEADMGADFVEEENDSKELINIQEYLKGTPDLVKSFKCQEVQINGAMYESYLVLTATRIEVIREVDNGMGRIHVKRPLTNIVKITAKKRHRDLITFKYGMPDGDNLIITDDKFIREAMKTDWNETFRFDEEEIELAQINGDGIDAVANSLNTDMSLLAVRSAPFLLSDYCSSSIRSASVSSSFSDIASGSMDLSSSDMLNLEDIKIQLSQYCLTCGVCWADEHFSFDCSECGGYSMIRPCLNCGGTCGVLWTRDFALSHACHAAKWKGNCKHFPTLQLDKVPPESTINFINPTTTANSICGMSQFFPNDLRHRLEKLEIKS
ncbi:CLUMA_CG013661, isoform A [Clunio marinus]|uniref:TBC1 domain family member 23 n=1 Tax=Clunio marinus TaxID=568069 RepID=A0A1J1IPH2_9DIPT|nr:CLUMA_CG013661, isoform A [Clunio marinus]